MTVCLIACYKPRLTMETAVKVRRTQEERSTETRGRILDAALESLSTLGYAGTTTTVVAERAGVSRGAQLHHFPTRASLVSAAVQHLFAALRRDFDGAFAMVPSRADRVGAAIDLLWGVFQDPRLAAVLELYVAGRTDADLRAQLLPVAAAHHAHILALARKYFPEAAGPDFDGALAFLLDTLQGLAVRQLSRPDDAATAHTLRMLKFIAAGVVAETPSSDAIPRSTE